DIIESRHIGDFTSLSMHDNVLMRTESFSAQEDWRHRIRFGGGYYHNTYDFGIGSNPPALFFVDRNANTFADGSLAFVTPLIYNSDKLVLEGGFQISGYAFDNSASGLGAGFFAPRSYQTYGGTGHIIVNPHPKVTFDVVGYVGPKRFFLFSTPGATWSTTGN